MIEYKIFHPSVPYFIKETFANRNSNITLICSDNETALTYFDQLIFFMNNKTKVFVFPEHKKFDINANAERSAVLAELFLQTSKILIISAVAFLTKNINHKIFKEQLIKIVNGQDLSIAAFSSQLINLGFTREPIATEVEEFAVRGDILDVMLPKYSCRFSFKWDKIDNIRLYSNEGQIIDSDVKELLLFPIHNKNIHKTSNVCEYINNNIIIFDYLAKYKLVDAAEKLKNSISDNQALYYNMEEIEKYLYSRKVFTLKYSGHSKERGIISQLYNQKLLMAKQGFSFVVKFIKDNINNKIIIFCSNNSKNSKKIEHLLSMSKLLYQQINNFNAAKMGLVNIALCPISKSFFVGDFIFICCLEIFESQKINCEAPKISSSEKLKNILAELKNLNENDFIVHIEHGIGQFVGTEVIKIANKAREYLKITYADNDKLYVPVENIEVIKKYGSNYATLDKLGGVAWQRRKSTLKQRIGDIAVRLTKIAAQRTLLKVQPVEIDNQHFQEFCSKFPYAETNDQLSTCEDVINDLTSGKLMDRLVCGDVGFGKTEIAMRAAFIISKACLTDRKQVMLITPTTLLCHQHYKNFLKRFKNFGLHIAQISRLVPNNEIIKVKEALKVGRIDIIIGTHALFAKDVKFANLGLIIIDEEHHFGVAQKEKLKELKAGVHVLSLSATPIPRSLQMSIVGVKDLSLITTPPIERLAVITSVDKYNPKTIKNALLFEHNRGGKSFYVCPKIKDLEIIEHTLQKIVPNLTYIVAHGQMSPSYIEKIIEDFYDGKYDILLSTAIIESGLDIYNANTIVVHQAETLGLSQLYQLRGRVGRGKAQGYAYFTTGDSKITKSAHKRLELMQTIEFLGSGFTIASYDMDIRGFGNLVGEEQSGHIKEVGVELYQEMLQAAVTEIINNSQEKSLDNDSWSPSINLGIELYIPEDYILDSNIRMQIYQRAASIVKEEEHLLLQQELENRFGSLPSSVKNLFVVVKIKLICKLLNIGSIDTGEHGFILKFRENNDVSKEVLAFINKYPNSTKIRPDSKLVVFKDIMLKKDNIENKCVLSTIFLILQELKDIKTNSVKKLPNPDSLLELSI